MISDPAEDFDVNGYAHFANPDRGLQARPRHAQRRLTQVVGWRVQPRGLDRLVRIARRWVTGMRRWAMHASKSRLLYRWHPWVGQRAHVHEVIEKAAWVTFRCSLTGFRSAAGGPGLDVRSGQRPVPVTLLCPLKTGPPASGKSGYGLAAGRGAVQCIRPRGSAQHPGGNQQSGSGHARQPLGTVAN